jgi:3'-5' exoribonuclease
MARRFVNELSDGETVEEVYLLVDKQLRANRNANLYLLASLRDRTGLVSGLMWNVTEESVSNVSAGDFVRIRGKVQLYQGAMQMILTHIQPVSPEGLDAEEFQPRAGENIDRLTERLHELLMSIDDPHLRALFGCFLEDEKLMEGLQRAPAGVKAHHAYQGGLLEHTVNILEVASRILDLYPQLDGNLLLAGVFLHDIGKIREMSYDSSFTYTDEGQLLGHLMIGVEMLDEKVAEATANTGVAFPQEMLIRLKHLILSHHGSYEFGSPRLPMTPEAIALHHLDNLDAKVHEFSRLIEDDPNRQSHWTPFHNRLQRKLFKGEKRSEE